MYNFNKYCKSSISKGNKKRNFVRKNPFKTKESVHMHIPNSFEADLCFIFFNWDSLHARLNRYYKAWSYKKIYMDKMIKKHTGNLFKKNVQLIGVC